MREAGEVAEFSEVGEDCKFGEVGDAFYHASEVFWEIFVNVIWSMMKRYSDFLPKIFGKVSKTAFYVPK